MKKKILTFILIGLMLFGGISSIFAADESATFTLNVKVVESVLTNGVRVVEGDLSASITDGTSFESYFNTAGFTDFKTWENGFVGSDIEGYFTILVRRGSAAPLGVTLTPTPLQKIDGINTYYLGYTLSLVGEVGSLIDSTGDPSIVPVSKTYTADNVYGGILRDIAVFKYIVPQNNNVPNGTYTSNLTFTITID